MAEIDVLLEELYRSRYLGFREALVPIVGDREVAHDVVQEAFAAALRHKRQLRRPQALAAWVWQIAYRKALRARKRDVFTPVPDDLMLPERASNPEVMEAIRALPPQRRLVVFLRYYAEFSYEEIAQALEISQGTVAATLAQARAALVDRLAKTEVL